MKWNALEDIQPDPDKKRPLVSVAAHPSEDISSRSKLFQRIKLHKDAKVYPLFGLDLISFLELPTEICDYILSICNEQNKQDAKIQKDVIDSINGNNIK